MSVYTIVASLLLVMNTHNNCITSVLQRVIVTTTIIAGYKEEITPEACNTTLVPPGAQCAWFVLLDMTA